MSVRLSFTALALCFTTALAGALTASGTIEGRVLDSTNGEPLPGATVMLEGSSIVASTDRTGRFRVSTGAKVSPGVRAAISCSFAGRTSLQPPGPLSA